MSRFRVASYNVHSCIGTDRRFAPERIADVVLSIDADIVAIQELGWHRRGQRYFDQFAYLADSTGYTIIEGPTKFHARAHYGNAILARRSVLTHRTLDLSSPLHIPRGCVMAEVSLGSRPATVINAHLGLTPWERRRQVHMLLMEIASLEGDIILMGDFNSWKPAGATFRLLTQHLPHYTDRPTFHARSPRVPLDRIYLSDQLEFVQVDVPHTSVTVRASDHLPIVADILRIDPPGDGLDAAAAARRALSPATG